ncbi:cyclopropane fatty acyl phospholipid synthase [Sphingomonas crocodyli]|uniref:Cyclopropane fatty acyl phospholipid synthase n=1 Tax=Sphingomonas crocodyli TaxID=1979270 RepID=A0A437LXT2_9SPHN|nr:cyclopropane fatty acyl phospholipid synthase [Sphingomonas crocodyli]RVT90164.1 cyclopropane fatty acyl phospholipid synthase [Sphingomonas crocodyli]
MSSYRDEVTGILASADIIVGGSRPHDIRVNNEAFFARFLKDGRLGLGEAYVDGWWDCDALDVMFVKLFASRHKVSRQLKSARFLATAMRAKLLPAGSDKRAYNIGAKHYDIGNKLYEKMLDPRMVYTCAYWKHATTLEAAQEAKLDLVCRKLKLEPGMHVLDVGCGWGSFAKFAAERYGVRVTGISVSKEQIDLGNKRCAGLPVSLEYMDYRNLSEQYDRIVSIGMFEHVGLQYYDIFMKKMTEALADDGLMLLHTIGFNDSKFFNPWLDKYIFPGAHVPSLAQITSPMENRLTVEHLQNIGVNYDPTLMAWYDNFMAAWPELEGDYDERFKRMWSYYLLSSAAGFRGRFIQVWQFVLSKEGVPGGYYFDEEARFKSGRAEHGPSV